MRIYKLKIKDTQLPEPNYLNIISTELSIKTNQTKSVLKLTEEGNTVHFIARYRKEMTGNLDEIMIRKIIDLHAKQKKMYETKNNVLKNISEQNKLSSKILSALTKATTLTEIDDIYTPFKKQRKTKANIALDKGFGPVAKQIREQLQFVIPQNLFTSFSQQEIIDGAIDIASQNLADDHILKNLVRRHYFKKGHITAIYKKIEKFKDEKEKQEFNKFKIYDNFHCSINKVKSHQILALNRGEKKGFLKVKLEKADFLFDRFETMIIKKEFGKEILEKCLKNAYTKIFASIEREIRSSLTEMAEDDSVEIFQKNLQELLMLKPHYNKTVLAIDPGYRTGCKLCVLNKNSEPIHFSKIFIFKQAEGKEIIKKIIANYQIEIIVVGNGTSSAETVELLEQISKLPIITVNESGASVYSTSQAGNEEFPALDATDRGTISIGRRYTDSLSELVKIPVTSIGIGMYQHDMNQKKLEEKLKETVEDVVNIVGINVNSASSYLLCYISGLNKRTAAKIISHKPYKSREELQKILTAKTYQQSAGFLRVPDSKNILDNTAIHPEQYPVAKYLLDKEDLTNLDNRGSILFARHKIKLLEFMPNLTPEVVDDIITSFRNAGKELRKYEGNLSGKSKINISDLKIGSKVNGIIRNITSFGAFVDIGLKNDALVHISELSNNFVKDPLDIVSVGQKVKASVIKIDPETNKINLSMKG